ncbi:MAG: Ig-like domain-containing protein, partial [Bacteriovorax sp.]|nr:Ig-like domain-containing protein [Bacteriovorax sp.]
MKEKINFKINFKFKYLIWMINAVAILLLQACMSQIKPKEVKGGAGTTIGTSGYTGCIVANGASISTIQVTFSFPNNASEVSVYRDGINVLSTHNRFSTTFTDINLAEGQTYRYECVATISGQTTIGDRAVDGTTLAIHPPTFSGIDTVTPLSPNSVRVTWPPTSGGAVAKNFTVYATMNGAVNFAATPKATITYGVYTAVISGLADDMPYRFGVRACNANALCDTNTKEISLTMLDGGAATTSGATIASLFNGVAQVTAPWDETKGAVYKRRLYRSTTNSVAAILSTVVKTVVVADLANPATVIDDNTIIQGNTYYYIERDEDPSGNITASTDIVTLVIGDLTAPTFTGLSSVALDSPVETSVLLGWTAITSQPTDPNGATYYLLYRTESVLPATPTDPCTTGVLTNTLSAASYTAAALVGYKVSGLTPRKKYSFCLKAQDAALNISNTNSSRTQLMPDITPPQFDGLQNVSYDIASNRFTMVWNTSPSSDVYQYKVKIWKNTISPTAGQITTLTYAAGSYPTTATFGITDFSFTDGDTVFMLADACDNASPDYNTIDNCTAYANSTAISKNLIDTTPPQGFLGVSSTTPTSQGIIQVNWTLPSDKSDYAGFKFYNIEEITPGVFSKVFLSDTYCVANSCATTPKTSYNLAVARDYHTYNIFVSAVDLLGNETRATDNVSTLIYSQVTSLDTTSANFTSSLGSTVSGGNVNLSWNSATDNQYVKKNVSTLNKIRYDIYRKEGAANFDTGTYIAGVPDIAGDVTIQKIANGLLTTSYADSVAPLTQGQTYNYTVCARDESGNVKCDGTRTETLSDNVPPVIAAAHVDEAPNSASWYLHIKVSDGVKSPTTVITYVYAKYSDSPTDFPDGSGGQVSAAMNGTGTVATPTEFIFYQDYLSNTASYHYVNYFIKAVDAASNVTTMTLSSIVRRPTIATATQSATISEDVNTAITLTNTGLPASGLNAANLSYEVVTAPLHGTLTNCMDMPGSVNGLDLTCSYIGNSNFFGSDTFTYRVKDNLPMTSTNVVTVNITITNVNDNPVATNTTKSLFITGAKFPGSSVVNVISTASDPDNDISAGINTLSVVTATPSFNLTKFGTISCSGLNCTISHLAYGAGAANFPYQINDGVGGISAIGTYSLKIYTKYTWTGAIDSDYSKGANWCGSLDVNGNCIGAATPPTSSDDVIFTNLCLNCNVTIPSTITVNSIYLTTNFTGIVTMGSGFAVNTNNGFYLDGGTFNATNVSSFNATSTANPDPFTFTGGTFYAPASTMTITSPYNSTYIMYVYGTGNFIHNNGTVVLSHSYAHMKTRFNNVTFYNLKILNSLNTNQTQNWASATPLSYTVQNDLTIETGLFDQLLSTSFVKVGGNLITNFASASNYGDISSLNSTLIGPTSSISMGDVIKSAGNITVDLTGTVGVSTTNLVVNSLKIKDGTFTAPTGNLSIQKYMIVDNTIGTPVFNHNNGTVIYTESNVASTIDYSIFMIPTAFNNLKVMRGYNEFVDMKGIVVVNGNFTQDGNALANAGSIYSNTGGGEIQVKGNVNITYTKVDAYNRQGATIKLIGTSNQTVTGTDINGYSFIDNFSASSKTSGTVSFVGTLRVCNNLDMGYAGTINMGTSKIMLGGWTVSTPTITVGSTQFYDVDFVQPWNNTVNIVGNMIVLNKLTINNQHTSDNVVQGGTISVYKDFEIKYKSYSASQFKTDIYFVGTGTQNISWTVPGADQNQMLHSNIYINKP